MDSRKDDLVNYLMDLIDYLDGRGLIVTDTSLLLNTLQKDFGEFKNLVRLAKYEGD